MAGLLLLILIAQALTCADGLARRVLRARARSLPPALSERLLEEWLAEIEGLTRARKLTFALGVLLTPANTFLRAMTPDDGEAGAAAAMLTDAGIKLPSDRAARVIASIIDFVIALAAVPVLAILVVLPFPYRLVNEAVIAILLMAILHVWCVARFGGSFGKLLTGIRIVPIGVGPLHLRHALLRVAPDAFFGIVPRLLVTMTVVASGFDEASYAGLTSAASANLLAPVAPALSVLVSAMWVYRLADLFFVYHREDHRSVRDLLAGTVVVYHVPQVVAAGIGPTPTGSTSAMR